MTESGAVLDPQKSGPESPPWVITEAARERLVEVAHQSPRAFGRDRST